MEMLDSQFFHVYRTMKISFSVHTYTRACINVVERFSRLYLKAIRCWESNFRKTRNFRRSNEILSFVKRYTQVYVSSFSFFFFFFSFLIAAM